MHDDSLGILIFIAICFVIGIMLGGFTVNTSWEKAAVEHGGAHWEIVDHEKVFRWNDELSPEAIEKD